MRSVQSTFYALLTLLPLCFGGCATNTTTARPLSDHLTLIPVSDKADIAKGLDMTYVYGADQGLLNHVSCDQAGSCWYSGELGLFKKTGTRMNPVVIRTATNGAISWARSYQIDDIYTVTLGLLPAKDGGALLYGNSFIGERLSRYTTGRIQPIYEKLDASGIPQWGGSVPFGFIKPWSAATEAIHLADGGYALTGSGTLHINGNWYGLVMTLDANGTVKWLKFMRIRKDQTFSLFIFQLQSGHILVAGFDASIGDIFLVNLSADGKTHNISIIGIRGKEYPVGFVKLDAGPAIVAQEEMPSGEWASVVIRLDHAGEVKDATLYRYTDGFNPNDVISMPDHEVCIYGTTEAKDDRKSLAFVLDAKGNPVSALALKGGSVFESGALLAPDRLVFAGGRKLGVNRHMSGLIVKWAPVAGNDSQVLKNIKRDSIKFTIYNNVVGTVANPTNPSLYKFSASEMQSRLVSGGSSSGTVPAGP